MPAKMLKRIPLPSASTAEDENMEVIAAPIHRTKLLTPTAVAEYPKKCILN
jgi:hypothetical protein